jgi:hypothetical protein
MDELTTEVLGFVNKFRKRLGLKLLDDLPQGERETGMRCPLARALGFNSRFYDGLQTENAHVAEVFANLAESELISTSPWYFASAPVSMIKWAGEFDSGEYPQYEVPEREQDDERAAADEMDAKSA